MGRGEDRRQSNDSPFRDSLYLLVVVAETLEKPQKLNLQGDVLKHTCTLMLKTVTAFQKNGQHSMPVSAGHVTLLL